MTVKFAVITAALLTSASPALAQNAAETFTGPFAGLGAGAVNDSVSDDDTFDDEDQWSADFTGFVGYDHALPHNFVVGVEAGAAYAADDDQEIDMLSGAFNLDPKYELNASGRLGYLIRPNMLLYGRGGYANLRGSVETLGASNIAYNDNFDGWLVGGGVEYAFLKNMSARAEYRYQDLSNGDFDLERNQTLVGVSYRF